LWIVTIVGLVSPEPMIARIRQSGFIGYLALYERDARRCVHGANLGRCSRG
jgi:hypothetical protein